MPTPPPRYTRFGVVEVSSASESDESPSRVSKIMRAQKKTAQPSSTPMSPAASRAQCEETLPHPNTSQNYQRGDPDTPIPSTNYVRQPDLHVHIHTTAPPAPACSPPSVPHAHFSVNQTPAPAQDLPQASTSSRATPGSKLPTVPNLSNMEVRKITSDALDRYFTHQRPGMGRTRVNANGSYEHESNIQFQDMGTPLTAWFVVTHGWYPGVYHNLQEALSALPSSGASRLEICKSEADAAVLFSRAFMNTDLAVFRNDEWYPFGPLTGL